VQVAIIEKLSASLLIKSFRPSHNQELGQEQEQEPNWDWLRELKFIKMALGIVPLMFMTCAY